MNNLTIEYIKTVYSDYTELRKFMCNKEYMEYILNQTLFLPDDATIKQRLWHIIENINESEACKCGTILKWNIKNNSYRRFCSSLCAHNDADVKAKTENTCIKKYGVKTNLITKEAKEHYESVMLERFGVDNPFKSKEVQDEIKNNLQKEHHVTNVSQLPEVKEKITQTHLKKYNRIRANQSHISDESYEIKYNKQELVKLYESGLTIKDIADKLNVGYSQLCVQFKNFGIELNNSVGQTQVYNYIKSIYSGDVILNDRKYLGGKEIDIFLPELNLGFEYDGIFWHSEDSSGKVNYHYEKDNLAKSLGIKLIHILDLEWNNKKSIVESRISSMLSKNKTIHARKTIVSEIKPKISREFMERNHIQGNAGASFHAGLYHDNILVAVMTFGKSRYNNSQFELIRFCNLLGHNVVGGASKLFKFAAEKLSANEIISFSDIRWGKGTLYECLGFKHIRNNLPSYNYTYRYKTFESRIRYQKHKLKNILPIYDPLLSEWENMKNNDFDRYWNSGNSVYVWNR